MNSSKKRIKEVQNSVHEIRKNLKNQPAKLTQNLQGLNPRLSLQSYSYSIAVREKKLSNARHLPKLNSKFYSHEISPLGIIFLKFNSSPMLILSFLKIFKNFRSFKCNLFSKANIHECSTVCLTKGWPIPKV